VKLSGREKTLMAAALICAVFFFYWQSWLNPLLKTIDKTKSEIKTLRLKLEYKALPPLESALVEKREIKIFSKEEQLGSIIKFIDQKFRWYGIKLISLRQTAEKNKLTIDLKYKASSHQFMGFLNALPQLKTVLVIDKVNVNQEEGKLIVEMRLLSAYK
jgi:type II secretory pathway component PulM